MNVPLLIAAFIAGAWCGVILTVLVVMARSEQEPRQYVDRHPIDEAQ